MNRKMKMLQEYWASTVILLEFFLIVYLSRQTDGWSFVLYYIWSSVI